jgi:hypothetical protein
MNSFNGRWLKRTLAIAGTAAIILVGTVLLIISLQHHFGSDFFDTSHTSFPIALLFLCIIVAGVFLLVRFNKETGSAESRFPGVRVNVLCLMGATLGFFCMYELTWASGGYGIVDPLGRGIEADWAIWPPIEYFSTGELYSWFFVVGVVLAFFTPLAGFLQLSGITVFAIDLYDIVNGPAGTGTWGASGFVLAIVAASIVLVSLAFPYGVGYEGRPIASTGRILTVSSSEFAEKIRRWRQHTTRHPRSTDSHR